MVVRDAALLLFSNSQARRASAASQGLVEAELLVHLSRKKVSVACIASFTTPADGTHYIVMPKGAHSAMSVLRVCVAGRWWVLAEPGAL